MGDRILVVGNYVNILNITLKYASPSLKSSYTMNQKWQPWKNKHSYTSGFLSTCTSLTIYAYISISTKLCCSFIKIVERCMQCSFCILSMHGFDWKFVCFAIFISMWSGCKQLSFLIKINQTMFTILFYYMHCINKYL